MKNITIKFPLLSALIMVLCSCSHNNDSLYGSSERPDSAPTTSVYAANMPALGTTNFEALDISNGAKTGTFVGQKVVEFRNDLNQLQKSIRANNEELQKIRASITANALQYHKTTSVIETKLQIGTTPGNPHMFALLQAAHNNVQLMSANTSALDQLSAKVTSDAAMTTHLLDSIRASYAISGAVDEDHRQLRVLENEASQTSILVNSLLSELDSDASLQRQYVENANHYLSSLDPAIKQGNYGGTLFAPVRRGNYHQVSVDQPAQRPAVQQPRQYQPQSSQYTTPGGNPAPKPAMDSGRPIVAVTGKPSFAVKFAHENVDYIDGLKNAVSSALATKPNASFDVVALTPSNGNQEATQKYAGKVFADITGMGVSPDKISLSGRTTSSVTVPEVQVFVR